MTISTPERMNEIAREAIGGIPDPLARYLARIGQERLLTHEEEIDLATSA